MPKQLWDDIVVFGCCNNLGSRLALRLILSLALRRFRKLVFLGHHLTDHPSMEGHLYAVADLDIYGL